MEKKIPDISIIVPVFKAENYLSRCIDSLLTQNFAKFEIILIDDGSPDRSGIICDEYAMHDNRIRVIHQQNRGVSAARQVGMEAALGEYIIHTDPDDWVEANMLTALYTKAKEDDADVVFCDFYEDASNGLIYHKQQPSNLDHEAVLLELFQHLHGSCWNKLVRRTCYNKYGIKFPIELSYCEDLYVNACLLVHDIKVSYLPQAFYHYDTVTNSNSLVRRDMSILISQFSILISNLKNYIPERLFNLCHIHLLYKQTMLLLSEDGMLLKSFVRKNRKFGFQISRLGNSYLRKGLLLVAFYVSPYLAHILYRYRLNY